MYKYSLRPVALLILTMCFSLIFSECSPGYKNPHFEIRTRLGVIEIEVFPDMAPQTTKAFLSYIDSGYYTNTSFYRILNMDNQPSDAPKSELIQGGIYRSKGKKNLNPPGIPHETTQQTGILHKDGTISLARLAP
ncbi:MAG: peptidylprolyl isomerase, partial [Flavitalea sp.]